jgi:hypothetical protein
MRREDMAEPDGIAGQLADSGRRPAAPLRAGALRARRRHQVSRPAPAGRQSPPQRTRCTATARTDRAVPVRRARRLPCEGHRDGAGSPRIVRSGPSSVKGTRRSFLTASQKGSPGPTLERWSLCRPSGPDGKGQAGGQALEAQRTSASEPATYQDDGERVGPPFQKQNSDNQQKIMASASGVVYA